MGFYIVDHKIESGKLYMDTGKWEDKEYMANITQKAMDPKWIENKREIVKTRDHAGKTG